MGFIVTEANILSQTMEMLYIPFNVNQPLQVLDFADATVVEFQLVAFGVDDH